MNTIIEKVKERPILFSTPMVVAVLDDRKDVTRRLTGLEEINSSPDDWEFHEVNIITNEFIFFNHTKHNGANTNECYRLIKCKYGLVGDILWVRETWARNSTGFDYKADFKAERYQWKPSIHMPKHACRLKLLIKSITVERLHDITEEDAKREGAQEMPFKSVMSYRWGFENLWQSINGKESWESNPWVWRIEFKKISN